MMPLGLQAESHLIDGQIKGLQGETSDFKGLAAQGKEKLTRAARNFESFMLSYMFKEMYKSIPKSDVFGNAEHRDIFMGLYMDEVSKKSALSQNGIASQLIKQYAAQGPGESELKAIDATKQDVSQGVTGKIKEFVHRFNQNRTMARLFKDLDAMVDHIDHKTSSDYGMRIHPISGRHRFHEGTDFALSHGTEVRIPASGNVLFAGDKGGYGKTVIVDHGHGVTSLYAHLAEITVKEGEKIDKKALVGRVGSTGVSTGPHLHFEVRKDGKTLDPKHLVSR